MAAVTLGSKAVGSIVKIKVEGALRDFIVIRHGSPPGLYDSSCNGTWVLQKDIFETHTWAEYADSRRTCYNTAQVRNYLENDWKNKVDSEIRTQIKRVKIPYCSNQESGAVSSGASGLSSSVFLLSPREFGLLHGPADGYVLEYCDLDEPRHVACLNGVPTKWWTRTPYVSTGVRNQVWYIGVKNGADEASYNAELGIRPAFILPLTLMVADDGTILPNHPPTVPSSITVPSTVYGGKSLSLSWGTSTDPDGNLEGYIVERQLAGGAWSQIYQGNARTTTNTVPLGSSTVAYRVKAYDSEGEASAYKTSPTRTVINNSAPYAPASITVPEQVQGGGQLAVSWEAASDSDGDLSGYSLERQVDGGAWAEVYNGANLSFTDNITKGWETVAYRVRAYDSHSEYGPYAVSEARTVNNNTPPVISCGETELGVKSTNFSVTDQVDDEEGDPVTVTELLDGAELCSFQAVLEGGNSFAVAGEDFLKLQNGPHSMRISASDGKGESVHELSFTKEITSAFVTILEPMEAGERITLCALSVKGEIPEDAAFTVEVTNNGRDENPVWEDCTAEVKSGLNYVFENETAQNGFAFSFRVNVSRGESGQGGYITSIQGGFQ